ncbi:MAG: PAS domain-containing sensor histidine kinase [Leptospirillia bacterium]
MDTRIFLEQIAYVVNLHAIVSMTDLHGKITYVNDNFCEVSGYSREELLGKDHRILKSGAHGPAFYKGMWQTLSDGDPWHGQIRNRKKDGGFYWVEATISPMFGHDGEKTGYVSVRTEITSTMELLESQRLQARVIEMAGDAIVIADARRPDIPLIHVNPAFEKMSGYSLGEILGRNCRFMNRDDRDQPGIEAIRTAVREGSEVRTVIRNYKKDGSLFYNEIHLFPVVDERGTLSHFVAIEQDVTKRILLEGSLIKAKEEADRANRAKSDFLTLITHELRTPLNAILGYAQLLGMHGQTTLSLEDSDHVAQILKAGWHLLELIDQLLDLGRIESGNILITPTEVDLRELAGESFLMAGELYEKKRISFRNLVPEGLASRADRDRLRQVLINLLSNAAKYSDPEREVTAAGALRDESTVLLSVSDQGWGMTPEQKDHLFESFNRLGAEEKGVSGTGVGLVIVKQLVERMGGTISVESQPGRGSVFMIVLPRA